jgi:hypothetical protein
VRLPFLSLALVSYLTGGNSRLVIHRPPGSIQRKTIAATHLRWSGASVEILRRRGAETEPKAVTCVYVCLR